MKKLISFLLVAFVLVTLTGCSSAKTNVSDKKEVLITVGKEKITKGDVYEGLVAKGDITDVTEKLTYYLASVAVKTTDEMKTNAQSSLDSLKSKNEDWDAYLKNNGFENDEEVLEDLIVQQKLSKITSTYVEEQFETLAKRFEARKVAIVEIDDSEKANTALKEAKDGKTMEEIASAYGSGSTYVGKVAIYTNQSKIPASVWNEIKDTVSGNVGKNVAYDAEGGKYYVFKVESSTAKDWKDELIPIITSSTETNEEGLKIDEEAFKFLLNKYDYSIHDATVYSALLNESLKYER